MRPITKPLTSIQSLAQFLIKLFTGRIDQQDSESTMRSTCGSSTSVNVDLDLFGNLIVDDMVDSLDI